jgi:putative N-acetylmannosamine-6-phosphate epimerase
MAKVVPLLESRGWRLVGAYVSVVGRVGQVIDVFEVPDANAVPSVLGVVKSEPEFAAVAAELAELIDVERTTLAVDATYAKRG